MFDTRMRAATSLTVSRRSSLGTYVLARSDPSPSSTLDNTYHNVNIGNTGNRPETCSAPEVGGEDRRPHEDGHHGPPGEEGPEGDVVLAGPQAQPHERQPDDRSQGEAQEQAEEHVPVGVRVEPAEEEPEDEGRSEERRVGKECRRREEPYKEDK